MTKLKSWLLHNTTFKIVSIIGGFLIWLFVANYSNPEIVDAVSADLLTKNAYSFLSSDQVYTLSSDEVYITYKVRSKYQDTIKSSDFKAYVDFSEIDESPVKGTLPVHVETTNLAGSKITDIKVEPARIAIHTEKIQQKKFAVECTIDGTVANGYIEGEVEMSPEYLYVKGPVSVIGQISSTGINIDIDGISEDLTGTSQIVFYDANGNELENIGSKLSYAGDISFTVPVFRTKSLSINAFAGGMPGTGYTVDSVETSPTFLSVYGPDEVLNKYSYVLIPGSDIDVNGITQNKTLNLDVSKYVPEGLTLLQNNPEITVYVKVRNAFENVPEETAAAVRETKPAATIPVPVSPETEAVTDNESESETAESTEETLPEETEEIIEETSPDETETIVEETAETALETEEETQEEGIAEESVENGNL